MGVAYTKQNLQVEADFFPPTLELWAEETI